MAKISIVILNWNGKEDTIECLNSLKKVKESHKIIVVDNGSADDSAKDLKERFPYISLVNNKENLGFSEGKVRLKKVGEGMLERLKKVRQLNRELRLEDLYQGLLFQVGIHPDNNLIDYIHHLYLRSFQTELIPGTTEVLEALHQRYKLAVISNAMPEIRSLTP